MPPDWRRARVDREKIVDYLLALSHPDGRSKAEFFIAFGFRADQWQVLAQALKDVATANAVASSVESAYGVRYTVDGPLRTPSGRTPKVRTVWIVTREDDRPRLITAYPI